MVLFVGIFGGAWVMERRECVVLDTPVRCE